MAARAWQETDRLEARAMGEGDCVRVERIEREAYEYPWTLQNFVSSIRAGHDAWLFGLGSARGAPAVDPCGYSLLMWAPEEVHLLNITVAPALQGRGIGAAMLDWLLEDTVRRGAGRMLLEVRPSNPIAIHLYESRGFRRIGLRRGYYPAAGGTREDAIVMARALP
ncbi:MAG: ribosomal protein S18-alanine N-acetyltransferase [Burkholderiaceae bacterium]